MGKVISFIKKFTIVLLIHTFNCFPIRKNKIFLFSYYGSQYGCNPKYITEYILKNYHKDKFDIVWAFNDIKAKGEIGLFRKVKNMSLQYFYELCTAKVIITNFRTTDYFVKRRKQYYIQTWHSSLRLKQVEKDAEESLTKDYVEMAKKDSIKCDLILSGCRYSTEIIKRAFWYNGEVFEHGTPRNDILFGDNLSIKAGIKERLGIPEEHKVVLYAPTFRKDNCIEIYNLDYLRIVEKLEEKFGGKWIFIVRLHPHLASKSNQIVYSKQILNGTSYDDIQELLSISDVLITDYSSIMFDFSLTNKPCFLYVPDVENYIRSDRSLYFDIQQLPFICATSNEELLDEIEAFDRTKYCRKVTEFSREIGTFEEGKACENLADYLYKICFN